MRVAALRAEATRPTGLRALCVAVGARSAALPTWLAHCVQSLASEGLIELVVCERPFEPRKPGEGLVVAVDTWIARRSVPASKDAWSARALASATPALDPEIEVCLDSEAACTNAPEHWRVRFGTDGTRFRSELERGDRRLQIEIVAEDSTGVRSVLARTHTKATSSLTLSRSRAAWKAAALLERVLRRRLLGLPAPALSREASIEVAASAPSVRAPRSFLARTLTRAAERFFLTDSWRLAWRRRPSCDALPASNGWLPEHQLVPPRGRYYADPFLLRHAGRECLFFEDYDVRTGLGCISCVELDGDGAPGTPRVVLATERHLSYPFVFEHEGRAYMIPETHQVRRIELWRATEFPWSWTLDRVLVDGIRAVDTTWLRHDGRFWLLACVAGEGAPLSEELCAFWSDAPFGPWQPHAANPIVDDPCGARPAGRPFLHAGLLVRPAQDVSEDYGKRIVFQEIVALDPETYVERTIGAFEPTWFRGGLGSHTYDRSERHEVVDLRTSRWKIPRLAVPGRASRGSR